MFSTLPKCVKQNIQYVTINHNASSENGPFLAFSQPWSKPLYLDLQCLCTSENSPLDAGKVGLKGGSWVVIWVWAIFFRNIQFWTSFSFFFLFHGCMFQFEFIRWILLETDIFLSSLLMKWPISTNHFVVVKAENLFISKASFFI